MADNKSLYTLARIREQNPFLRKLDQVHRQWQKVLLAKKVVAKSNILAAKRRAQQPSYAEICCRRYRADRQKYNARFRAEVVKLEAMQPTANDAMRFHRHFTITTLWPPIFSEREISWTLRQLRGILSQRERRRLEQILG